jgi:hypothetical protein
MKNVLIIIDGKIGKTLLQRIKLLDTNLNKYDIVYTYDNIIEGIASSNFTFYKFDPTSYSKLSLVLNKTLYQDALVVLTTKEETIAVIHNIRRIYPDLHFTVYDKWGIELDDKNVNFYKGYDIISNGLVEQLPNIPVFAQNIGIKQGEIMEIRIPFGSSYAYRYLNAIAQKKWKIVALYRNQQLLDINSSLIIKPNDTIIVIGKPYVLMQVYNAISKVATFFPMPFGKNIYLIIDMFIQSENEVLRAIQSVKILHQRMRNHQYIIKITRPTTALMLQKIKKIIEDLDDIVLEIDYSNKGIKHILQEDKIRFDIGMFVLSKSFFEYYELIVNIVNLKTPIFKLGKENLSSLKHTLILLNDNKLYEQIAPVLFNISAQLKIKPKIIDTDPIGDKNRDELIEHINNLSKIFTQNIIIQKDDKNPITMLQQEHDILQILPLQQAMFKRRKIKFFTTNSDLLSFDLQQFNQVLIPIETTN